MQVGHDSHHSGGAGGIFRDDPKVHLNKYVETYITVAITINTKYSGYQRYRVCYILPQMPDQPLWNNVQQKLWIEKSMANQ